MIPTSNRFDFIAHEVIVCKVAHHAMRGSPMDKPGIRICSQTLAMTITELPLS
jgi:hypothetical protein